MSKAKARFQLVVVAAGRSRRMGEAGGERKPFLPLAGATVLEQTCRALARSPRVGGLVVVSRAEDVARTERLLDEWAPELPHACVEGGAERTDSVRLGAEVELEGCTHIAVHDAARPCVSAEALERLFDAAEQGAALLALPVADTLKRETQPGAAGETVPRQGLWSAQTPQVFPAERFRRLLRRARDEGFRPTDDAALWERYEGPVQLVPGDPTNLKITYPEDLAVAERIMRERTGAAGLRVGTGFDLHRLVEGRPCILGGVELPHDRGPAGHSDGDAVLHAVTDAVLGAAGLDDIGTLFPDTDERHRDAESGLLLRTAMERVAAAGWRVINMDIVIATEGPRIAPHREAMRASIAACLGVEPGQVNVKGKTLEGMGALAAGTGVAVHATCLLSS